ncbi:MAG: hypothetical protein KAW67_06720, partial [Candidatus Eisenbacteria sp.]|nr:hypothetical protein [Candidatus Eisenbacteria bacterium]
MVYLPARVRVPAKTFRDDKMPADELPTEGRANSEFEEPIPVREDTADAGRAALRAGGRGVRGGEPSKLGRIISWYLMRFKRP